MTDSVSIPVAYPLSQRAVLISIALGSMLVPINSTMIAFEAITNVVHHARARQCEVCLRVEVNDQTHLHIEVSEDGMGLPPVHRPGEVWLRQLGEIFKRRLFLLPEYLDLTAHQMLNGQCDQVDPGAEV